MTEQRTGACLNAFLACNARTFGVDNLCHYYDRFNPLRPASGLPSDPRPSRIEPHPLFQPSFPRPGLFAHVPEDVIAEYACA